MLDVKNFRDFIVRPALYAVDAWSLEAEQLVLGTAVQESLLSRLKQYNDGPALGLFQMEPATYKDIWFNFLRYKVPLRYQLLTLAGVTNDIPPTDLLMYNLRFAAAMCRVHYLRKPGIIPIAVEDQARYWKEHYNTYKGKGTVTEYIDKWHKFVGDLYESR